MLVMPTTQGNVSIAMDRARSGAAGRFWGSRAIWGANILTDLRAIWGANAVAGSGALLDANRALWGSSTLNGQPRPLGQPGASGAATR